MRSRYIIIIFSVLTVVTLAATFLHSHILKQERIEQIDQQVRDTAARLLDSQLATIENVNLEKIDDMLSTELGETRIGKLFLIRNEKGEIIFQSVSAKMLGIKDVPSAPKWATFIKNGKYIRVLNLDLPKIPNRTMQVGIVVATSLIYPDYFSRTNILFMVSLLLIGLLTAFALTNTLLIPISRFVSFLSSITEAPMTTLPPLPDHLARLKRAKYKNDELSLLIDKFSDLIEKVNRGNKLSRVWSYQMAHELKTPLAIIQGEVANGKMNRAIDPKLADSIQSEIIDASEVVTTFLTWAELENATEQKNLFAISVSKVVEDIQLRLNKKFPNRLVVEIENHFTVLTNMQHFEYVVLNLISNALTYSAADKQVRVKVFSHSISIKDSGCGIPKMVLDRIGEPFNKGLRADGGARGHGLGLAYVQSVCKLYGWQFRIQSNQNGSEIILGFPEIIDHDEAIATNFVATKGASL